MRRIPVSNHIAGAGTEIIATGQPPVSRRGIFRFVFPVLVRPGLSVLQLIDLPHIAHGLIRFSRHITHILQGLGVGIGTLVAQRGHLIVFPPVHGDADKDIGTVVQLVVDHVAHRPGEIQFPEGRRRYSFEVTVDPAQTFGG